MPTDLQFCPIMHMRVALLQAAAPNSPRTPLSVGSAGGSATFNSDSLGTAEKSAHAPEPEASASGGLRAIDVMY